MPDENLETVILTRDDSLFAACRLRFAESRVGITLARDSAGFKDVLRGKTIGAIMLDAVYTEEILGSCVEDAVVKLAPLLSPRIILVLAEENIAPGRIVRLLELGAHDVLPKPVRPRILAEQLKALVRVFARREKRDKKIFSSPTEVLVMDYPRRRCYIKEVGDGLLSSKKGLRFTKTEFQILYLLLRKKGAVVTYADFREYLWSQASSSKEIIHTLHQLIANIRKKIASCPAKIENLRADGFRLV